MILVLKLKYPSCHRQTDLSTNNGNNFSIPRHRRINFINREWFSFGNRAFNLKKRFFIFTFHIKRNGENFSFSKNAWTNMNNFFSDKTNFGITKVLCAYPHSLPSLNIHVCVDSRPLHSILLSFCRSCNFNFTPEIGVPIMKRAN